MFFLITLSTSCVPQTDNVGGQLGVEEMIRIARRRDCYSYFGNSTFDICIFKIAPYFDQLSEQDREVVVINFILHGNLDAGSALAFSQLINPYHSELENAINTYSDEQLKKEYSLSSRQARRYREGLEGFLRFDSPRKEEWFPN